MDLLPQLAYFLTSQPVMCCALMGVDAASDPKGVSALMSGVQPQVSALLPLPVHMPSASLSPRHQG